MTARQLAFLGAAAGAIATAAPASAQPEMPYEYSHLPPPGEVIYRQDAVVQPLPGEAQQTALPEAETYDHELEYDEPEYDEPYADEYEYREPEPEPAYAYDDAPLQPPGEYYDAPPPHARHFDREAWLDDCRARYRGAHGGDGAATGGIIGAVAGGVIGNRVADGDRLAGTLIGAGVGGLAGLAVGSAVDSANERDRVDDYCEAWLDRHSGAPAYAHPQMPAYPPHAPSPNGYGYPATAYGYGYPGCGCGYAMTYVPVVVQIPQRAVVREYVTEEWVEVERPAPPKRRKIHRPAPRADKRIKYSKGR